MPDERPSIEEMLGDVSLLADTIPMHTSAKLDYGGITAADALHAGAAPHPDGAAERGVGDRGGGDRGGDRAAGEQRPVPPNSEEAFYLLATYCFDLQRKMEYLHRVTRALALRGNPALARELLDDEEAINRPGLTWKQRAFRAEVRMLQLQREIGEEHLQLLRAVARRAQPRQVAADAGPPKQSEA